MDSDSGRQAGAHQSGEINIPETLSDRALEAGRQAVREWLGDGREDGATSDREIDSLLIHLFRKIVSSEPTPDQRLAAHFLADATERLRYQHQYAIDGFKALILLNGGAVIALLTYAGHDAANVGASGFRNAFFAYAGGLVTSVLAYLVAYLSQASFANYAMMESYRQMELDVTTSKTTKTREDYEREGNRAVNAGVALSVLSLVAFVLGSWFAMQSLS